MLTFTHIRQRVASTFPANWLIRQSQKIRLPGFQGIPLYDVLKFFFQQIRKVGITERAAAISFNCVMAIPPIIIFLCTLIPYLPISNEFIRQLHGLIRDVIPGEKNNSAIIKFIDDIIKKPKNDLLSLGFLLAIFYSSNAVMGIMRAFDKNYLGFKKRKMIRRRATALQLTSVLFVLMFASLLVLIMQSSVLKLFGLKNVLVRQIIGYARWVVIVLLFFSSVSFIYRYAPFVHKRWKLINPGCILATTLMLLFTVFFSYWVNNFSNYNKLYGSISTILILMLLIYFNSLVLLIGFELNVSITHIRHEADERNKSGTSGNDPA
ncbi:MAG TPA: YihY/virulence factor BrkB family protein [Chitinophagaceae bacterium]|nr:YihY/virulence factor BrkB family protein [Chitinophagaceae bacterium]